jgi:UDP-N-acetylmuramoyl-tripeptide--D-alanyl-D-alanine ligase
VIPLTLREVAAAAGGTLNSLATGDELVTGTVEFDSRRIVPGGLFVAFDGANVDGHDFVAAALAAGAVGALVTRDVEAPAVIVADQLDAMGRLARAVLDRLPKLFVIGLTGSSGKTSTKDLLAQVLARLGPTVAPPGSFNNELGHPYTVLRADHSTAFLVLEMGSRGLGHIRWLCQVAPPKIGIVLNVGAAHLGEFGGLDVTARAKGELVEALGADGLAVLNADDERVRAMAVRTGARVVLTGRAEDAEVRATDVVLDAGRPAFTLRTPAGEAPVRLGLYGEHQIGNALAVAGVAAELGMPVADIAQALSEAIPLSGGRMTVTERADGVTIIDDAYNANPDSMRAALAALVGLAPGRRAWAVLGQMNELGEASVAEHEAIGALVASSPINRLVTVGHIAGAIHEGAVRSGSQGEESVSVPDVDAATRLLRAQLRPGDVVLVKASNSAGLGRIAAALAAEGGA